MAAQKPIQTGSTVEHDPAARRFVAHLAEGDAYLAYEPRGHDTLDLQHTVVPEEARNRGVGEALVRAAFDHARRHNVRIIPSCPFVEGWLADHPDARDLLAVGG